MKPNIEQKIAETVARQSAEDQAGMVAATTPLPGPLRDVFAPDTSIKVGRYEVRPFYDIDFEFLSWLEHPLHRFMNKGDGDNLELRGPNAWVLAWILTRPAKEVRVHFRVSGVQGVRDAAADEFGTTRLTQIVELCEACLTQAKLFWAPKIDYATAPEPVKEGEVAQAQPNPPSSAAR